MGNRAVVKFVDEDSKHGVYLHWNGGPESILAFLAVMEARGWTRMDYASARFTGVVCEYFDHNGKGDGYSLGIVDDPDNWKEGCDNGLYVVEASPTGGFRVTQYGYSSPRGRVISANKLNACNLEHYEEIVRMLAVSRQKRQTKEEVTCE